MDADGITGAVCTYQWARAGCVYRNDNGDIAGQTATAYRVTEDDLDCAIELTVSFTNDGNFPEQVTAILLQSKG